MKINSIKISNVFSFKYEENIDNIEPIVFDDNLNILIGPNGAGKSNFLETINQIFKKVFFLDCRVSVEKAIDAKNNPSPQKTQEITNLRIEPQHTLEKNNQFNDKPTEIKLQLKFSKQDRDNLLFVKRNIDQINRLMIDYYGFAIGTHAFNEQELSTLETMEFTLIDFTEKRLRVKEPTPPQLQMFVYQFLHFFEFIQNLIIISNRVYDTNWLLLKNTFALIGSSREYQAFESGIAVDGKGAYWQNLKNRMTLDSTKNVSNEEPIAMPFLKYKMAVRYTQLREELADSKRSNTNINAKDLLKAEPLFKNINKYLKESLKLELDIIKPEPLSLEYIFSFKDKDGKSHKIPELSSGERGVVHFIFSIFGYDLENGLMIIDEPELHIHPQMQEKYLQIMIAAQKDLSMQFIVATHSSIFINPDTISGTHRFFKDDSGFTHTITARDIKTEDIDLVRILRYTDSSKIFFSNKVILVEGDTDEFFYRSFFDTFKEKNNLDVEAEFLQIRGRTNYEEWKIFLGKYHIPTYFIGDLDNILRNDLPFIESVMKKGLVGEFTNDSTTVEKMANDTGYRDSKSFRNDLLEFIKLKKVDEWKIIKGNISGKYSEGLFVLQEGALENYMATGKGLKNTVNFCKTHLESWYVSGNDKAKELKSIFATIFGITSNII